MTNTGDRGAGFGIAIPQSVTGDSLDGASLRRLIRRAEALGFASLWVQEQAIGSAGLLEPVALLGYAASLTSRARLGSAVILSGLRGPVELARALASLDQLSGGRLIVGIGVGDVGEDYAAFGQERGERVARFVEGLEVMRRLWTEERVTYEGRYVQLRGVSISPRPLQRRHPPIWFGAHRPAALRRAVALADGWIGAGASSTTTFRAELTRLREEFAATGRDPSGFAVAKRVYVAVDARRARASERLRRWFALTYGDGELAERVAVTGDAVACAAALDELRAAGAHLLILNPVYDEERQLEILAAEVLPRLAGDWGASVGIRPR